MRENEDVCLCFHVSRRKVEQFIRVQKPTKPSQLAECYGAGTGCGWCRPFLKRLLEDSDSDSVDLPDAESYAQRRNTYRDKQS